MDQNLIKTPLFLVGETAKETRIANLLERGIALLDEYDEAIRSAYEASQFPPAEIEMGDHRLVTSHSKLRNGFKVLDENRAEIIAFSFMIHLGKSSDKIPDYPAYKNFADIARAFLQSLKEKAHIDPASVYWKSAIKIMSMPFSPEQYDKITYAAHFPPSNTGYEGRTAYICHIKGSVILTREYFPDHRPLYTIIHPCETKADFIVGSSVTHVPGKHELASGIDNMPAAQIAGRVQGLAE